MEIQQQPFGRLPDGAGVDLFTLRNQAGMEAQISNYGGIVVRLCVPDRQGRSADIVLGFDTLAEYLRENLYFGAIVGRYAGFIAGGRFALDGKTYVLAQNEGSNHLHGGIRGFDKVLWQADEIRRDNGVGLCLSYLSRNGEEGYPGNLEVTVTYTVTAQNEFRIDYAATTDKPTVVNLTHHSYFNLAGHSAGDILQHELMIAADHYNPILKDMLLTGEVAPVRGTPLDFTRPEKIGARIEARHEQIAFGLGYDHNWVLNGHDTMFFGRAGPLDPPKRRRVQRPRPTSSDHNYNCCLRLAARVREPTTGRVMEVFTTEPGLVFYASNMLRDGVQGKGGAVYRRRGALCLEAQHFPDSPNMPHFPTTVLRPGQRYRQITVYRFES